MSLSPYHDRRTSDSGSPTGSFCSSRPLTALKSAVFAPIPSASDSSTTAVQPLDCSSIRTAYFRSLRIRLLDARRVWCRVRPASPYRARPLRSTYLDQHRAVCRDPTAGLKTRQPKFDADRRLCSLTG